MSNELNKIEAFNNALTSSWDNIADPLGYVTLPAGVHSVRVSKVTVEPNKDQTDFAIVLQTEVTGTQSMVLEDAVAPAIGSLCAFRYFGAEGVSRLKKDFSDVAISLGLNSPEALIEGLKDIELGLVTGLRADKEKKNDDGTPVQYTVLKTAILL